MSDTMTTANVAELVHHPDPTSPAAVAKVRRLIHRGLPVVPGARPWVFIRAQVIAWLAGEAAAAASSPAPTTTRASGGRRRARGTQGESALRARARELRTR